MDCLKKPKGKKSAWVTPEKMKHTLETAGLFERALFSQTIELHFSSIQLHMTWNHLWKGDLGSKIALFALVSLLSP